MKRMQVRARAYGKQCGDSGGKRNNALYERLLLLTIMIMGMAINSCALRRASFLWKRANPPEAASARCRVPIYIRGMRASVYGQAESIIAHSCAPPRHSDARSAKRYFSSGNGASGGICLVKRARKAAFWACAIFPSYIFIVIFSSRCVMGIPFKLWHIYVF